MLKPCRPRASTLSLVNGPSRPLTKKLNYESEIIARSSSGNSAAAPGQVFEHGCLDTARLFEQIGSAADLSCLEMIHYVESAYSSHRSNRVCVALPVGALFIQINASMLFTEE